MQWVYTGGVVDYYSYAEQFFDMFPKIAPGPNLELHHLPQTDHLASLRADRQQLLELVTGWCGRMIGTSETVSPTLVLPMASLPVGQVSAITGGAAGAY